MRTLAFVVLAVIVAAIVAVFALLSGHAAATTAPPRTVTIQVSRSLVRPILLWPTFPAASFPTQDGTPGGTPNGAFLSAPAATPYRSASATASTSPSASPSAPIAKRSVTTPPAASATAALGKSTQQAGTVWDRLARCESGGDWQISTGNGYWGGLQEDLNFWRSYGDPRWPRPDLAPKAAQIAAAVKARDAGRGYGPWPACSKRLGLS